MSTTYTDLEQISDTTGASTIGHENENEKFKDQCFLKFCHSIGVILFCLFMLILIQYQFSIYNY